MTSLQDHVSVLSSVGPKRLEALQQLGIETIEDLLTHFPFRYEDITERYLSEILDQEKVTLKGTVITEAVVSHYGFKKNRLLFRMTIGHDVIAVSFFNQHYLKNRIHVGQELAVYGKWDEKRQTLVGMKLLGSKVDQDFEAIYHTNKSIRQSTLEQLIKQAYERYETFIPEMLPLDLVDKYALVSYREAIQWMHFPDKPEQVQHARLRLIYQELFLYQLKLLSLKQRRYQQASQSIRYDNQQLKNFIQQLPFTLTNAQKRVVNEICRDLLAPFDMNRLLQGDVGSGKTVVAAIAIMATQLYHYQSAVMVPTEILAQQHFQTFQTLFAQTNLRCALLTSSTPTRQRDSILAQLADGSLDCVIGTHALIQPDVTFQQLGLVIIDEQHRFGVQQRQQLKDKASACNVLYMSATPIPRTLTMTIMGDMDVSVIDELPAGRQPIQTRWVKEREMEKVLQFIGQQVKAGRQAYIITPLIDESETLDVKNAQAVHEQLAHYFGEHIHVGLLHGRMKPTEKEAVMQAFQDNQYQVLVSTTVIEVGVNVPNATIMVIQDADRFGLSQLHQLRGRVGRGQYQSYCILVATPKTESGKTRMTIMTESTDGFYLSQKDMEMRGSGDLFGLKQSGLPDFHCADVIRDAEILVSAQQDAMQLLANDNWQSDKRYELLRLYTFGNITDK